MNGSANKGSHVASPVASALNEKDLPEAERIFRVAFGTFLGAPDPELFWADRRLRPPSCATRCLVRRDAKRKIVGSNFATNWGSVGFFGPITVRPDLQERCCFRVR